MNATQAQATDLLSSLGARLGSRDQHLIRSLGSDAAGLLCHLPLCRGRRDNMTIPDQQVYKVSRDDGTL